MVKSHEKMSDKARETRKRLEHCWDLDLTWSKYPKTLREVGCMIFKASWSIEFYLHCMLLVVGFGGC